ncbi:hypothetical protein PP657_gp019 [Bacillus phage BCPST]|uniref:Uncharacterized protein n=1 Tax=Bacillus phage BCPST TaxID=2801506 RepID=A0AAE7TQB1_9CAUD|nr:hypothetical protein PP657_gp019 [Bacillus phage BCPST]QQO38637.1 hypothetical protein BCPST_019 [Bacillus phage BCPST]QSJ04227.1 hypothetical protein BCP6_022 [Bacillus phage BCP6]
MKGDYGYGFNSRNEYIQWFKSLKIGDKVCYANGWRSIGVPYSIVLVERITKTGWVKTSDNLTFVDGNQRGGYSNWDSKTLQPVTNEVVRAVNEHRLRNHFKTIDFQKFSYDELLQIHNFIEAMKSGKEK